MAEEQPPPSYNDTTSATPNLILRSPPFPRPGGAITLHYINIVPHAAPTSFPYPEPVHFWLSRDVRKEDWASFVANLLAVPDAAVVAAERALPDLDRKIASKNDDSQTPLVSDFDIHQRMYGVLAEWNEGFFKPRGLKVVAGGDASHGASHSSRTTKGWKFGPDKFGFQLGNVLFGIDASSSSKMKPPASSSPISGPEKR